MRVKIIGAGSAGIHLAEACRRMGWEVWILDNDRCALDRMYSIYKSRYGEWDKEIHICESTIGSSQFADIIIIATPPDVRMKLALGAIRENPKLLHLEKPLCTPDLKGVAEFDAEMEYHSDTIVTVGYNHAVSKSIFRVIELLRGKTIGEVLTIDVEFREHWKGIFAAHPWLSGPRDSYLGYWKRGGGAGNEHSHALHLWCRLAREAWGGCLNLNLPDSVSSSMAIGPGVLDGLEYDHTARFTFEIIGGHMGSAVQDVITYPPKKFARIQGSEGFIEWQASPSSDVVSYEINDRMVSEIFPKKRPDDFYYEMQHYAALFDGEKFYKSPLDYEYGLEVMKILNKAYYG